MGGRPGISNSTTFQLRNSGITNHDSPHFSDLISDSRRKYGAFCTSDSCTRYKDIKGKTYHKSRVEKRSVEVNVINCPDCGFALVWREYKE